MPVFFLVSSCKDELKLYLKIKKSLKIQFFFAYLLDTISKEINLARQLPRLIPLIYVVVQCKVCVRVAVGKAEQEKSAGHHKRQRRYGDQQQETLFKFAAESLSQVTFLCS
jgi:hypothetical protein